MVICLERGADLHMAQLMPLPLTVSCFSKIQIGFTSLVLAHPGSPGQRAVKRVCVMSDGRSRMQYDGVTDRDRRRKPMPRRRSVDRCRRPAVWRPGRPRSSNRRYRPYIQRYKQHMGGSRGVTRVTSHPPGVEAYFMLLSLSCVWLKLFQCRFVPLHEPNPGDATAPRSYVQLLYRPDYSQ